MNDTHDARVAELRTQALRIGHVWLSALLHEHGVERIADIPPQGAIDALRVARQIRSY